MTEPSTPTPSTEKTASRRAALMVAVSEYADSALRQLRSPAGDAAEFGQVLGGPDLGGFEVMTVLDERAYEIRLAVEDFLNGLGPEDLALVYLSCHGLVDARRRLYFAATDTLKDRLASTGVEARWLLDQLEECRARRQVVILDCCFSGAFAAGTKGDDHVQLGEELLGQGRGRVVLTASRATEYSFEGTPTLDSAIPGSVFTAALAAGIHSGAADYDNDGYISVDDAYAYAFDEMRAAGAQQTPQRWLYGAEGDIVLAKNPSATGTIGAIPIRRPVSVQTGSAQLVGPTPSGGGRSGLRPPQWWKGGRTWWLEVAAAVIVAVIVAVVVVAQAGSGSGDHFSFTNGTDVDTSVPWRITISDQIEGSNDQGCIVKVRESNPRGHVVAKTPYTIYRDNVVWQRPETGKFFLDYPDGCIVNAFEGRGDVEYPVTVDQGMMDSMAWNPTGAIALTISDDSDGPCDVLMVDGETGNKEVQTVKVGQTTIYVPPDTSSLYMSVDAECFVKAQQAGTDS